MSSPDIPRGNAAQTTGPQPSEPPASGLTHAPSPDSDAAGHETTDVNIRGVLWLAVITVLVTAIVQVGLWLLLASYHRAAERSDPELPPLAEPNAKPPGPQLQSTPLRDYQEFHDQQEQRLNSYGWADGQAKSVHIPVSRAIDLLLERGLPEPAGQAAEVDSAAQEEAAPSASETTEPAAAEPTAPENER